MKLINGLTILLLLTACLGQLNRLPLGSADSGIILYANDIIMGLVAVLYLAHVLIVRKSWIIPKPLLLFTLFITVAPLGILISHTVLSGGQMLISLSYWVRYVCYAFIAFIAFDNLVYASPSHSLARLRQLLMWLLAAALLMSLSGFIQLYFLPDFANLAKYGWDPHIGRLATAMLDPNYAGAYLSIGALVAVSLLLYSRTGWQRLILAGIAAILIVAIVLTYSRSAYVMLISGLAVIAFFKARWLLVAGAIIGLAAFVAIPRVNERVIGGLGVDTTSSIRIISWVNSLTIAADNQPFGIGFNSYRYAQDRYGIVNVEDSGNAGAGADSSWLFILATTGLVGLLAYAAFYGSIVWGAGRSLFHPSPWLAARATQLATVAVLFSLIPASMINNSLFYTWILQPWWLLVGLSLAISHRSQAAALPIQADSNSSSTQPATSSITSS